MSKGTYQRPMSDKERKAYAAKCANLQPVETTGPWCPECYMIGRHLYGCTQQRRDP